MGATRRRWTKKRAVREIAALHSAGKPLNLAAAWRSHGALTAAARRLFGSWNKALVATGIDPESVAKRHVWTRARLIRELRMSAINGTILAKEIPRSRYNSMRALAASRFGSWRKALKAAGLRALHPMQWTKEEVLRQIRRRARIGLGLSQTETIRTDRALVSAAWRVFRRPWSVVIQNMDHRRNQKRPNTSFLPDLSK